MFIGHSVPLQHEETRKLFICLIFNSSVAPDQSARPDSYMVSYLKNMVDLTYQWTV